MAAGAQGRGLAWVRFPNLTCEPGPATGCRRYRQRQVGKPVPRPDRPGLSSTSTRTTLGVLVSIAPGPDAEPQTARRQSLGHDSLELAERMPAGDQAGEGVLGMRGEELDRGSQVPRCVV